MYIPVYVRLPVSATSSFPWPEHRYAMSGNPGFTPVDLYEKRVEKVKKKAEINV